MKRSILNMVLLALTVSGCTTQNTNTVHPSWDYKGDFNPVHWGSINAICEAGRAQSPIDIITSKAVPISDNNVLEFHESTHAELSHEVDNGHAIKITPSDDHGISIEGRHYKLVQFHFHGRSEHFIDGNQFDMELHMVHQDPEGNLAVVGILIEEGAHNVHLEEILNHLDGGDLEVVTANLFPKDNEHYYHYVGSLTTPPCSENVHWYILKEPITADKEQIKLFRSHHDDNFRPLQSIHGRYLEAH